MAKNTRNDLSDLSESQILQAGFTLLETSENSLASQSCLYCNTIVFIINGSVKISSPHMPTRLVSNQHLCFLQMKGKYTCEFAPHSKIVLFTFGNSLINELNVFRASLDWLPDAPQSRIVELDIIEPLDSFLKLFIQYREKNYWDCRLYNSKREELFCLFKKMYSQEELSHFYGLLTNSSLEFENKVAENFMKVKTVKELANLMGYGVHTFRSKFKEVFGIPASQWLQTERAKLILYDLIKNNVDFKTIIDKYGFTSHSHFYKFCKKHYKLIPEELRKRLNK